MKVGIIGAGIIAETMAKTLMAMEDATCYGIASRNISKAQAFAEKFNVVKAYGCYEEMVSDGEIDLVYIATPHSFHAEHAKLAIKHGKPVLCEKPFMVNAKQAKEIYECGKQYNVLVAEAIWTRYLPSRGIIDQLIAQDKIGTVTSVTANLGYVLQHVPRIIDPALAGGALLDVGVYAINFACMILGSDVKEVISTCVKGDTGVDMQNAMIFKYENGTMATLHSGALASTEQYGIVYGSKGYIIAKNINNITAIEVYNSQRELVEVHDVPKQITGFEYQVRAVMKAIRERKLECEEMPHAESIKVMEIMDDLRAEWGITFPCE